MKLVGIVISLIESCSVRSVAPESPSLLNPYIVAAQSPNQSAMALEDVEFPQNPTSTGVTFELPPSAVELHLPRLLDQIGCERENDDPGEIEV